MAVAKSDVEQRFQQGLAFHQKGQLDKAERCYEQVLRREPGHVDALYLSSVIALQTRRFERAVTLSSAAVRLNPRAAPAYVNRGIALEELGRLEEALTSYEQAIQAKPDYVEAYANLGLVLQALKRFDTALASYDRAIRLRPDLAELHSNRGLVLNALHRLDDSLASFDRALRLNPNFAEAHSNRGLVLEKLKRPDDAVRSYERAIQADPNYADAYLNRGKAQQSLKRYVDAVQSYDKAIALNPAFAEAYYARGTALHDMERQDETIDSYDKAIALNSGHAEAYSNRGLALEELRRLDEAIENYDRAIRLNPDFVDIRWNKSMAVLTLGRLEEGWQLYEWRKKKGVPIANHACPQPAWTGAEDIAGRTVFLYWEQGFGDTLHFCRYARMVAATGARVVMSVQDRLVRLLKQWEPGIEIVGSRDAPPSYDFHAALMSLPLAFGTTLETIPSEDRYLRADPALVLAWGPRLPAKARPRIGFVWNGNAAHENDRNRSMALTDMLPLLSFGADWVCLQKNDTESERTLLRQSNAITFLGDEQRDFADTAAIIEHLDLVISVDTAVAHLAGAMGKPVWIVLSYVHDWRWLLERRDTPWYPATSLYRQPTRGDWPSVIEQIKADLAARFT